VFDNHGYGNSYIEEDKLGEAIRNKYPFFSPSYSATMEMVYYANHCENALCGVLQGDHYVLEWTMSNEKYDKPDVVEKVRR